MLTSMAKQVPVTKRALVQRINRALAKEGAMTKAARGAAQSSALGDFYVVDVTKNAVITKDVDIEAYGRELGVLQAWERLSAE